MIERKILVYVDLDNNPCRVGTLWTRQGNRDSASFEYDRDWLDHPKRFALEPALQLASGTIHTGAGRSLFGAIGDSAPDRWGRVLIQREERRKAKAENRAPRTLSEGDYLLGVGDITRQGALRFRLSEDGEFLTPQDSQNIPPLRITIHSDFGRCVNRRWAQDGFSGRLAVRPLCPLPMRRARYFHLRADFGETDIREPILLRQLQDGHRPYFIIELVAPEGDNLGNLALHPLSDKLLAA